MRREIQSTIELPIGRRERGRRRRAVVRRIRKLKTAKPSRRHVERALMVTVPSAALFGYVGANHARAPAPSQFSAPLIAGDEAPVQESFDDRRSGRLPEVMPAALEASYYGDEFAGRPTANGETFNPRLMTAAHRTLPFGTLVKVTDASTGKDVTVRINDRGPFHGNREIDLSEGAAQRIGMTGTGTAKVHLQVVRTA